MKRILLVAISLLLFGGCMSNEFEIENRIFPKVLGVDGDEVSLEYMLGKMLILDTISVTNTAEAIYIQQHAEDLNLRLKIFYDDGDPLCGCSPKFHYYLGMKRIARTANVISAKELMANYQNIPNFVWLMKDDKTINRTPEPNKLKSIPIATEGKL